MTVNNKLMLEPYKGSKKIEGVVKSGFATIKQKSTLVGLKIMADARIPLGREQFIEVKKGQIAYYPEEILHASDWSTKLYNLNGSEEQFVLGEALHVVAIA